MLSVRDYGATGDGVTDDTAAVLEAFEAAVTSGKALYFPAGIYMIDDSMDASALSVSSSYGIAVVGEGMALSQVCLMATSETSTILKAVRMEAGTTMLVRDIYLDASLTDGATLVPTPTLDIARIERGLFQNLRVKGSFKDHANNLAIGIRDAQGLENTYRDILVTSCKNEGMLIDGPSGAEKARGIRVVNARFKNNTGSDLKATANSERCVFDVLPDGAGGGSETFDEGPNILLFNGTTPYIAEGSVDGTKLSDPLRKAFAALEWDSTDQNTTNVSVSVTGHFVDADGQDLAERVVFGLRLSDTGKVFDTTKANVSAVGSGMDNLSPLGQPTVGLKTDANGDFTVTVTGTGTRPFTVDLIASPIYGTAKFLHDRATPLKITFS